MMRNGLVLAVWTAVMFGGGGQVRGQTTWYVDGGASPPGNGSAAAPFTTIHTAINAAQNGDSVLVLPGTYLGPVDFQNKAISLTSRDGPWVTTIDALQMGTAVRMSGLVNTPAVLQGFRVTGGRGADGVVGSPGQLQCDPFFPTWCWCSGGVDGSPGGPGGIEAGDYTIIRDCVIIGNEGGAGGPSGGQCSGQGPGGVGGVLMARTARIVNSLVARNAGGPGTNVAGKGVGGVYVTEYSTQGVAQIVGCTVAYNTIVPTPLTMPWGGIAAFSAVYMYTITNTIVWGNDGGQLYGAGSVAPMVTHSCIQGGYPGAGNIDQDPLFQDLMGDDFHLGFGSPCIDAGDATIPNLPAHDWEGDPRVFHGAVDIGCDETVLMLNVDQPGGPGTGIFVQNANLTAGREYFNIFSGALCPGGPGTGPSVFFGICLGSSANADLIATQLLLPVGAAPVHFIPNVDAPSYGPFAIGPAVVEGITIDVTGGTIVSVSRVVRLTAQ